MYHTMRPGVYGRLSDLTDDYLKGKTGLIGIEIGSYAGESTEILLRSGAFFRLYCIDPWEMGYDSADYAGDEHISEAEQAFNERFKGNPVVVKIRMKSHEAKKLFDDESIDFIYIDGNHQYDAVRQDLEDYGRKIKTGGVIAGHDYNSPAWPGVTKAVDEYIECKPDKTYVDFSYAHVKRKNNTKRHINIASTITLDHLPLIYMQINSIKQNKRPQTIVDYFLFVEPSNEWTMNRCAEYVHDLESADFHVRCIDASIYKKHIKHSGRLWIAFLRCLFPKAFLSYDKLLYLDADVMCLQPGLEQLFDIPMDKYYTAAVSDPPVLYSEYGRHDDVNTGNKNYFNSGVLLLNLQLIRDDGIDNKLVDWCNEWNSNEIQYCWQDQTLLNYLLRDKVLILPYKWNNQFLGSFGNSKEAYTRYLNEQGFNNPLDTIGSTVLLHFCGWNKPWKPEAIMMGDVNYPWVNDAIRIWNELSQRYKKK